MKIARISVAIAGCVVSQLCVADNMVDAREVRSMLMHVLSLPDGTILSGKLIGSLEKKFLTDTRSSGPFTVEVQRLRSYPSGCGRVQSRYFMPLVPLVTGEVKDLTMVVDLDICPDGSPPSVAPGTGSGK